MPFLALHRVQVELGPGLFIDIESSVGQGRPISPPPESSFLAADEETDTKELSPSQLPAMCWRDEGDLFEPLQLREDTDYFVDITIPLHLSEARLRSGSHQAWPFSVQLASAFTRDPVKRWREVESEGRRSTVVTGQLRLRSHAGVLNLATELGGYLRVEVVCSKLKYFEEFKALLDGLAERATELLLAYDSPVSLSLQTSNELAISDAALHFLMRYVMSPGQLPAAIGELLSAPHAQLIERLELKFIEDIEQGQDDLIAESIDAVSLSHGGPLARLFGGFTPRELPQLEIYESRDTPENRYAKAFIQHCEMISQSLQSRMLERHRRAAEREANTWSAQLGELLQNGLWREVGPLGQIPTNSQIMLRKRGYKELFRLDVALRMSLDLVWPHGSDFADGLVGDIRPVNQIYEYWCFFVLREILQGTCTEKAGGNFLDVSADGLRIQLKKGRRSECRFEYVDGAGISVDVSLFYNRRFRRPHSPKSDWSGSYTASFDPDYSILIKTPEGAAHWLHFDAKYRLERQHADEMFESDDEASAATDGGTGYEDELARVYRQDDLFKMHTYRDGILSTRGAYVLFPGDGVGGQSLNPRPNIYTRHPSAFGGGSALRVPSVGAFPLTPENTGEQVAALRQLIRDVLNQICSGGAYAEERAWFGPSP